VADKNNNIKAVADIYASFLLELAKQHNCCKRIDDELEKISCAIEQNRELATILDNPFIALQDKNGLIERIFAGRIHELTMGILKSTTAKRLTRRLKDISTAYSLLNDSGSGTMAINITLAEPVSEAQKNEIEKKLSRSMGDKPVRTKYRIDPSIIGGIIIGWDDKCIDNSIRETLNIAKKQIRNKVNAEKIIDSYEV
jgi:F-type H+-transporting ATPase subunit delta